MELIVYTTKQSFRIDVKTGNITYGKYPYSVGWKFKGFIHTRRNEFVSLDLIKAHPEILKSMTWKFKNGKGQFTVRDNDHGTTREWGDRILGAYFKEAQP